MEIDEAKIGIQRPTCNWTIETFVKLNAKQKK